MNESETVMINGPAWDDEPLDDFCARMDGLQAGLRFARLEAAHDACAAVGLFPGRTRLRHLVEAFDEAQRARGGWTPPLPIFGWAPP